MATVSFNKNKKTEEVAPTAEQPAEQQAIVVKEEQPVAAPLSQRTDFIGDWNASDINRPRVNLIHKTSKDDLITNFGIGSFVLNKEVKLSDGKTPLRVTAVSARKDYLLKRPFGDPEPPVVCNTLEEVRSRGGVTDPKDSEDGKNVFVRRAHVLLLIEAPENLSDTEAALFPYTLGDKNYTLGILTVSSSAYGTVANELATLCSMNRVMRQGLTYGALNLTSEDRKDAKNSWKVPVIKYAGANTPEMVDFANKVMYI